MHSQNFTRRQVLKTVGASIAIAGIATAAPQSESKSTPKAFNPRLPQPFALPKLGYSFDALEPFIDAQTMQIHHGKHHQAYVDGANKALAEFPDLRGKTAEDLLKSVDSLPEKLRTPVRNHVGGHVNHALFWETMGPRGRRVPQDGLAKAIDAAFGSFDAFKARFTDAAMKRFGSGWAWLSMARDGSLSIHSTANQDSPIMDGFKPLLGIDVWEHAYYLKYQNRRLEYVEAFYNCIRWEQVESNFGKA